MVRFGQINVKGLQKVAVVELMHIVTLIEEAGALQLGSKFS